MTTLCAGIVSVCAATSALAADRLTLEAGGRLELHDNAALLKDEESDLVRVASANIGYDKPDGVLIANVAYQAERRDYLHDTQGDENIINGNTSLLWHIAPRQLDAVFYHQIAQQLTDRTGPDVTSNREERSIITAGLDGFLHFSPVDSVVVRPRFSDVDFQDSTDSNSKRATVSTTWTHALDALSGLDLTGNFDHVTFDESTNDYDGNGLMLGYHAALARLSYQLGAGYNRIDRDEGKDFSGTSARAGFDYRGESGFTGGAIYVRQLTDSSIGLSGIELTNSNFQSNDSNFDQPDTIQKDQFDVYMDQKLGTASNVHVGASYLREDYKDTLRDQNIASAEVGYRYQLNTYWSFEADVSFERTKFLDDPNDLRYDTTRSTLALSYQPLRKLEISFSVGQDHRSANVSSADYTDNYAIVGFNYTFL